MSAIAFIAHHQAYTATVTNTGGVASDYVLLGFLRSPSRIAADPAEPLQELFDFARVSLAPGASTVITLSVPPSVITHVDAAGDERLHAGDYEIEIGAGKGRGDAHEALTTKLTLVGPSRAVFSFSEIKARSRAGQRAK